jgi:hypothetical protein
MSSILDSLGEGAEFCRATPKKRLGVAAPWHQMCDTGQYGSTDLNRRGKTIRTLRLFESLPKMAEVGERWLAPNVMAAGCSSCWMS